MTGTIPLFLNPAAGRGRAGKAADAIRSRLAAAGIPVELVLSSARGDLEKKVHDAAIAGADRILVAGGDGSVHEAVNGVLQAGTGCALGLVPAGTGNDFAKSCAIPLDWRAACDALAERLLDDRAPRRIDAGRMNGRYFVNGAGIGFDARVNRIAHRIDWPIGGLVYLVAVLKGLVEGVVTPDVRMRWGNRSYEGPLTLANVSSGPWVGGLFHIAPGAENDDGIFDLVYVEPVSRPRVLALLPKLMRGTHVDAREIHRAGIRDFELVADAPLPSHLDGEVQPLQTEFRIRLLERALAVL